MTTADHDFVADCRVRAATDVLAHRWDPVVLAALGEGRARRVDLKDRIGGMRDKPLTESLARLVRWGLVERERHRESPPRVTYGLTALGWTMHDGPLTALAAWAVEHGDELLRGEGEPVADP
ncbi:winged helix-turn-helix transcriptional regulator [Krasilnikoviella flava]|uniref:Transcriptional regulator, HxlR family n=1 Tax=Krasilnikoviella flava TaxID=526729 RepID=A0A1T5KQT5_9MICO|nr:helix-turn-helix domain-containing protein [Krasilnikoviella flava]SKC66134.1 transcriptional regulator, HxlR family [Krasilnikoviella flava]